MNMKFKLSTLMLAITANTTFAAPAPNTSSEPCNAGYEATACLQGLGEIGLYTDTNGFNPAGQGFGVYTGQIGSTSVPQIKIIDADRFNTKIQTENGTNLTITQAGAHLATGDFDGAGAGSRVVVNGSGVAIDAPTGKQTQFLSTGVQFNNQTLDGVNDGAVTNTSKQAVNGSQLFAVETKADNALAAVGAAQTTANNALTAAGTAQTTANNALTAAGTAQTTANNALTAAGTAQTTANNALTAAGAAQTTADNALTAAGTAQTTANNALTAAGTAQTTANNALTAAGTAQTTANNAHTRIDALDTRVTNVEGDITNIKNDVIRIDGRIDTERAERIAADNTERDARILGDADTLASANTYTDGKVATEKSERVAADNALNARVDTEKTERVAADNAATADRAAIRSEFAAADTKEKAERVAADNAATADRAAIRTEMTQGDARTLAQSKAYTDQRFNKLETHYQAAIASSVAIASLPQPTEAGGSMVSAGLGQWESETGYAIGVSGVSNSNKWVYKAAGTGNSRGNWGGGVSVGFQWK